MKHNRSGTTLIELLIYMAIFSIMLISITELFVSVLDMKKEAEAVSTVEQDGRYILNRLAYDIRRADAITLPAAIGASSNTLSLVIAGQTFTYSLNGSNLELTNAAGTVVLHGSETGVSSVNFVRKGNAGLNKKDTISVSYTVTGDTIKTSGAEVQLFSTTVGLR